MINTTDAQKAEIQKAIKSNEFYRNEKVWNFLMADILSNSLNRNRYIELFCNNKIKIESELDIWYEAEPLSPRKGKFGNSEDNTKLDLAFGNIRLRENTQSGIEYAPEKKGSWVCFVESKYFSDCSTAISHDPLRTLTPHHFREHIQAKRRIQFQHTPLISPQCLPFTMKFFGSGSDAAYGHLKVTSTSPLLKKWGNGVARSHHSFCVPPTFESNFIKFFLCSLTFFQCHPATVIDFVSHVIQL